MQIKHSVVMRVDTSDNPHIEKKNTEEKGRASDTKFNSYGFVWCWQTLELDLSSLCDGSFQFQIDNTALALIFYTGNHYFEIFDWYKVLTLFVPCLFS